MREKARNSMRSLKNYPPRAGLGAHRAAIA